MLLNRGRVLLQPSVNSCLVASALVIRSIRWGFLLPIGLKPPQHRRPCNQWQQSHSLRQLLLSSLLLPPFFSEIMRLNTNQHFSRNCLSLCSSDNALLITYPCFLLFYYILQVLGQKLDSNILHMNVISFEP